MIYDTHCHPYLAKEKSQDTILENFFTGGGIYMNSIACDLESSKTCLELSQKNTGVYATIGVHPTHCIRNIQSLNDTITQLSELYENNKEKIVAIGESGLDYYWLKELAQKYQKTEEYIITQQKEYFRAQISLAKRLELPLIIHNRAAKEDIFQILIDEDFKNFIFHCYSEDLSFAQELLDFAPDCMIGFGGIMTFKNAVEIQEAAKNIPLKNIIIETDSPYLTPTPLRGKEENEPLFSTYVLEKLCELREESPDMVKQIVFQNSCKFFGVLK